MLLTVFLFFSCATGGREETPVNVFDYFSGDFDIYITIPVRGNEELITALAEKLSPGTDIQPLLSRMTVLRAAFNIPEGGTIKPEALPSWQLAAEGRFPRTFAGMALNRKNGWIKNTGGSGTVWYDSVQGGMQIAIPDSSMVLASGGSPAEGEGIETLLLRFASPEPQQWPPSPAALMYSLRGTDPGESVRFYLAGPEAVMKRFLGNGIRFPVTAIDGELFPGQSPGGAAYLVNLRVYLGEPRLVRPAAVLFRLLLQKSFPDAVVETGEESVLYMRGLNFDAGKIAEMIGGVI